MTRPHAPHGDSGMILFNVLTIVAVSSAVVMLMISSQDLELRRTQRLRDAAQASAYARAGELSAVTALRRDMIDAAGTDNLTEPWAKVSQADIAIRGGRFNLVINDAQSRFNLNAVGPGGLLAETTLRKLVAAVRAPPQAADRIVAYVRAVGPVVDLADLSDAGVDQATLQALAPLVTALPGNPGVNINTADEQLIALMLDNPLAARILTAQRDRAGLLTPADLTAAGVVAPRGLGFTSDLFWVRTTALVGDTRQSLTSLLERRRPGAAVEVVAVSRKRGAAAPDQGPPQSWDHIHPPGPIR